MLDERHLAVLYDLLSEYGTDVPRRLVADGTMSVGEIVEATQALADELNRAPIIDAMDLE